MNPENPNRFEAELSDDALQNQAEQAHCEKFIEDWVSKAELSDEQRSAVEDYIRTKPGAWREYNGSDFRVVSSRIEDGVLKVKFGMFFDDFEAHSVEEVIPLSS